jgi:hypothetical protein
MNNKRQFSIITLVVALFVSVTLEAQQVPINQLRPPRQWSPQAKGAVIGGATGAAAGAIIHKRNRVVGGVVGGAVGAGAGYAIGKRIDNKRKAAAALAARRAQEERIAEARRQDQIAYGEANRTMRSANGKAPALGSPTAARTAAVAVGAAGVGAVAPVVATPENTSIAPAFIAQNTTTPAVQPADQPVAQQATVEERTSVNWLTTLSLIIASASLALCGWLVVQLKKR